MHCNYKVVINYWNTKTHLILSLILHEFQQQSISGTVWSRSGSASGSTERSVQLDAWYSLYSPGLLWGFPSLPVMPSKFAFLYPVSSSGLSISTRQQAVAWTVGFLLISSPLYRVHTPCLLSLCSLKDLPCLWKRCTWWHLLHSGFQRCPSVMGSHSMAARFLCLSVSEFSWWTLTTILLKKYVISIYK